MYNNQFSMMMMQKWWFFLKIISSIYFAFMTEDRKFVDIFAA